MITPSYRVGLSVDMVLVLIVVVNSFIMCLSCYTMYTLLEASMCCVIGLNT